MNTISVSYNIVNFSSKTKIKKVTSDLLISSIPSVEKHLCCLNKSDPLENKQLYELQNTLLYLQDVGEIRGQYGGVVTESV